MTDEPHALPLAPDFVPRQVVRSDLAKEVSVIDLFTLERLDDQLFRNRINQTNVNGTLFGGQVLAQSLAAACGTVPESRPPHSLHGYFVRAGDASIPVLYQVERTLDGGSFSMRRVIALQKGLPILHMECSFHQPEHSFDRQMPAPDVPRPEDLAPLAEILQANADRVPQLYMDRFGDAAPFEVRPVDPTQDLLPSVDSRRAVWIRMPGMAAADSQLLHQIALTYLSDFWLPVTAVAPYVPMVQVGSSMRLTSLNHAMWFHRPLRADEWLLYDADSPSMVNGTGISRGMLYDSSGILVASVTQETLFRQLRPKG
jgi:acyl-CoA thioesterase-2